LREDAPEEKSTASRTADGSAICRHIVALGDRDLGGLWMSSLDAYDG